MDSTDLLQHLLLITVYTNASLIVTQNYVRIIMSYLAKGICEHFGE